MSLCSLTPNDLWEARPLLLERTRCLKVPVWQCWCPDCTGSILFLCRERPDTLPPSARDRVHEAVEKARATGTTLRAAG